MSRLEWLQMKRTCASYGPPLTPYEQVELFRLEAAHNESHGHPVGAPDGLREAATAPRSTAVLVG
jgi:hypothetical protein